MARLACMPAADCCFAELWLSHSKQYIKMTFNQSRRPAVRPRRLAGPCRRVMGSVTVAPAKLLVLRRASRVMYSPSILSISDVTCTWKDNAFRRPIGKYRKVQFYGLNASQVKISAWINLRAYELCKLGETTHYCVKNDVTPPTAAATG